MDFGLLLDLRKHITVAHHVPGRIRLKFAFSLLGDKRARGAMDEMDISELPGGIRSYRLNIIGRSLAVEYDTAIIDHGKLDEVLTTSDAKRFEELAQEFRTLFPQQA